MSWIQPNHLLLAILIVLVPRASFAQNDLIESVDDLGSIRTLEADRVSTATFSGHHLSPGNRGDSEHWGIQSGNLGIHSTASEPGPSNPADTQDQRLTEIEQRLREIDAAKRKLPSITINGVFQADAVWFDQSANSHEQFGLIEDGAAFRRARLSAKGSVAESTDYFMQMDFGFFGRPTFTDVWVDQKKIPYLGTVRVGQWKQPFSLEVVSSFRYMTFMERSSLFQALTPFRHIGAGFYNHTEDLNATWAMSYFRSGQDQFGNSLSTNGGHGMAARLTRLLWFKGNAGQQYLHIGGAYFLNSPPKDKVRFRSVPEIFVGEFSPAATSGTSGQAVPSALNGTPFFVDTGSIDGVHSISTFGLEALWVNGPWSIQSEAMGAQVEQATLSDAFLGGAYAQVGYFLTGEHRPFDRKSGAIDRVIPHANFKPGSGGTGAWEVAARWSYLDLNSRNVAGGLMQNLTTGINWFINPYTRWEFNYIHSWVESHDFTPFEISSKINSATNSFGTRVQLDF
jgi:phosphate-selective porin OprO and OprP